MDRGWSIAGHRSYVHADRYWAIVECVRSQGKDVAESLDSEDDFGADPFLTTNLHARGYSLSWHHQQIFLLIAHRKGPTLSTNVRWPVCGGASSEVTRFRWRLRWPIVAQCALIA